MISLDFCAGAGSVDQIRDVSSCCDGERWVRRRPTGSEENYRRLERRPTDYSSTMVQRSMGREARTGAALYSPHQHTREYHKKI